MTKQFSDILAETQGQIESGQLSPSSKEVMRLRAQHRMEIEKISGFFGEALKRPLLTDALISYQDMVRSSAVKGISPQKVIQDTWTVELSPRPLSHLTTRAARTPILRVPISYYRLTTARLSISQTGLQKKIWLEVACNIHGTFFVSEYNVSHTQPDQAKREAAHITYNRISLESVEVLVMYLAQKIALRDNRSLLYYDGPVYFE